MVQNNLSKMFLIYILIFCLAGCATTNDKSSSGLKAEEESYTTSALAVRANLRFSDIAVPAGFKLDQNKSFVFQTEETRVALLKYTGRASLEDLITFYQEQMLIYNWELLNIVEYDKSILNFERASQSCIVTIEPRGGKKTITISIAPKSKRSLKAQAQAKE